MEREIAGLTTLLDKRGEDIRKLEARTMSQLSSSGNQSRSIRDVKSESDMEEMESGSQYGSVVSELDPFEEQLRSGSIVDPRLTLAQELVTVDEISNRRVLHVNSGKLEGNQNGSGHTSNNYSKHKYPLKPFDGTGTPSASKWLNHFDEIADYHEWDSVTKVKEFRMAMFGSADIWLRSLNGLDKVMFDRLLEKFQLQFGGSDAANMDQAIYALEHIKQGKESMVTFAPKIKLLINTVVTDGNKRSKLYHFYRAITPTVFEELRPSRPATLVDAPRLFFFAHSLIHLSG
ncbi:hypothetical protein G6F56_012351 [Rhizopus delemar]|nr:hypothetical protein G6F56_012351 [Rhizopus delemar]